MIMDDGECNNFFVYGTLVDLDFFIYMFKHEPSSISEGWISAMMYNCGTFPMILEDRYRKVYGRVYTVNGLSGILPAIDRYERCIPDEPDESLYLRKRLSVTLSSNERIDAWVYVGNTLSRFCRDNCVERNLIAEGRWRP